jgi:hypothetical protein
LEPRTHDAEEFEGFTIITTEQPGKSGGYFQTFFTPEIWLARSRRRSIAVAVKSVLWDRMSVTDRERIGLHIATRIAALDREWEESQWYKDMTRWEAMATGDFSWRPSGKADHKARNIYDISNRNLPVVRNVAKFVSARLATDLFGTDPWLAALPEGLDGSDGELGSLVARHLAWKLRLAETPRRIKQAARTVITLGFVPVKCAWDIDEDFTIEEANCAWDPNSGQWILTGSGERITDQDEFIEVKTDAGEVVGRSPANAPEIILDENVQWRSDFVERGVRLSANVAIDPLNWRAVRFPLTCTDLDQADFVFHRYQIRWADLKALRAIDGVLTDEEWDSLKGQGMTRETTPESEEAAERDPLPAVDSGDIDNPLLKICECWFRYDAIENGRQYRISVIWCEDSQEIVDLRFLRDVTPRAQVPVKLVRIYPKPNLAIGTGFYEIFEDLIDGIDKALNCIHVHNLNASDPIKAFQRSNVRVPKTNPNLELYPGAVLEPTNPQLKASDILSYVALPDLDSRTWQLMELFLQLIQLESGVTNASQANVSDLPSNTTATGINSMLESSSVLHRDILDDFKRDVEKVVELAADLVYRNQDTNETFTYLEGQAEEVLELAQATRLRNMRLNLRLVMTRARLQAQRDASLAALNLVYGFLQQPPPVQERARPIATQALKAMEIEGAEAALAPFEPQPTRPAAGPGQEPDDQGQIVDAGQSPAPALPSNVIPEPSEAV